MSRIQNRVADVRQPTREADVFPRLWMGVMRLCIRQVTVVVVLMHKHDGRRAVNDRPAHPARLVDHPVVPAGATDGEIGNVQVARFGKEEEIGTGGAMQRALMLDNGR